MAQTNTNIVFPGPCKVFIAAHSRTALEAAPASTVAMGTAWGGGWTEVGFTEGGVAINATTEHLTVGADQVNAALEDFVTAQAASLTFATIEATFENMKQALGYGTITTGSTEKTLGVNATDGLATYYSVGFEVLGPGLESTKYRRAIFWKALPKGEIELSGKKDEKQMIGFQFDARYEAQATSGERLFKLIDRVVA